MENKEYALDIILHYYLNEEGKHTMDAFTYNKCEKQLLDALRHVTQYIPSEIFRIEVAARDEGGVIERLKVILNKETIIGGAALLIINNAINLFFNQERNFLDATKSRLEIIEKMKSEQLSEEEAQILIQGDPVLARFVSTYYESLRDEATVKSVESTISCEEDYENENVNVARIERRDFETKILHKDKTIDTKQVMSTTVNVISPVLIPMQKPKWRCMYNGNEIMAEIDDNDFLDQVYNKEVKFESGTSLTCDLTIKTISYPNNVGKNPLTKYYVDFVREWSDGEHYVTETKKYKSIKQP